MNHLFVYLSDSVVAFLCSSRLTVGDDSNTDKHGSCLHTDYRLVGERVIIQNQRNKISWKSKCIMGTEL